MARRECEDCGAIYYEVGRTDIGICPACKGKVADDIRVNRTAEPSRPPRRPQFQIEMQEAMKEYYRIGRGRRGKKKRRT